MRIVHVVNVRWFNATAWYALFLVRLLREQGHDCLVVTLDKTETCEKARQWGLPVRTLPLNSVNPLTQLRLWWRLRGLMRRFKPDVINCHRGESFFLFALLRRCTRAFAPFVLVRTRGDQRLPRNTRLNRWLHRACTDAVIVTNSVLYKHFQEQFHLPRRMLHCIPGGVDEKRFRPCTPAERREIRAQWGYTEDQQVIGLAGRFDEVKGHKELICAVSRLYHQHKLKQVRLLLLGFDTTLSTSQIQAWLHRENIEHITVITGPREDIARCLCAVDLGVVASKWSEAIARVAVEMMACACPLTGTRVGVMPDLLEEEALFPPADIGAMTSTLLRALTDTPWREKIAQQQARRIAQLSSAKFCETSLAVYQNALLSVLQERDKL